VLTWLAGESGDRTFDVPILTDSTYEPDETVILTLSNAVNCSIGGTNPETLTILDDDVEVDLVATTSSGDEGVTPVVLQVQLNEVHTLNVTVNYAVTEGTASGAGVDYSLAAGIATITAGNLTSDDISITIVDDSIQEANETIEVTLSNPVNASLGTNTIHTYTIVDNESLNFIINPTSVNVPEGSTGTFNVRLNVQPLATVYATVSPVGGDDDLRLPTHPVPMDLVFTSSNWNTDRPVTISALEDDDTTNGSALFRVNADSISFQDVTATEVDNDALNFETDTDTIDVPEGSTATFQVRLTAEPPGTETVNVTWNCGDIDITVQSGSPLVFDSTNWSDYQTVTLAAAEDPDESNGSAIIRINSPNTPYKDITATETDNDTLSIQVNTTTVSVPEDGSTTTELQVRLTADPVGTLTVTADNFSGDTDIQPSPDPWTFGFNSSNYNSYQNVLLTAAEDTDATNGSATIRFSGSGVSDVDVTATEQDNDATNGDISLTPNPAQGTSGQTITVAIEIADNSISLSNFGFDFVYDEKLFNFIDADAGSLNSNWTVSENETQGTVNILGTGGSIIPLSSTGSIINITLQVECRSDATEATSPIRIENYSGDMADQFSPEPCSTTFTFIPCFRLGDVNGDGSVTPGDAQMAFEGFLGLYTPDLCEGMTSDANCDGSTTPGDAQDIFEHFLGIQQIPECCAATSGSVAINTSEKFDPIYPPIPLNPTVQQLFPLNRIAETGEIVHIPVVVTHPEGIQTFGFDMNYPKELLEYLGVTKSPMTDDFDYVTGVPGIEGMVRIEGVGQFPITERQIGSLAVAFFLVKEGLQDSLPIYIYNQGNDIYDTETERGIFTRLENFDQNPRSIVLGEAVIGLDGMVRIPLEISEKFNIKSFGLEIRYSTANLEFVRIERSRTGSEFSSIQANEVNDGIVRVGGYGRNEIQETGPGRLVELIFIRTDLGGEIEIIQLFDDIQDFFIQNDISLLSKYKGSIR